MRPLVSSANEGSGTPQAGEQSTKLEPPEQARAGLEDVQEKALELIYETARAASENQLAAYRGMEEKAMRHLTLLGIILGGYTVGLPTAVDILTDATTLDATFSGLFALFYLVVLLAAFIGLLCARRSLEFEQLSAYVLSEDIVGKYALQNPIQVRGELAQGYVDAFYANKAKLAKKVDWARRAYAALGVVLWALIPTSILFTILLARA